MSNEKSIIERATQGAKNKGSFEIMDMILLLEQRMPKEPELIEHSTQSIKYVNAVIPTGMELGESIPCLTTITTAWKGRDIVAIYYGYKNVSGKLEFTAGTKILLPTKEIESLSKSLESKPASAELDNS